MAPAQQRGGRPCLSRKGAHAAGRRRAPSAREGKQAIASRLPPSRGLLGGGPAAPEVRTRPRRGAGDAEAWAREGGRRESQAGQGSWRGWGSGPPGGPGARPRRPGRPLHLAGRVGVPEAQGRSRSSAHCSGQSCCQPASQRSAQRGQCAPTQLITGVATSSTTQSMNELIIIHGVIPRSGELINAVRPEGRGQEWVRAAGGAPGQAAAGAPHPQVADPGRRPCPRSSQG